MIFVGAHHKMGTALFRDVFRDVAEALRLSFYAGWGERMPADVDLWFMAHSRLGAAGAAVTRGVHVVRHPFNVIRSACRYHKVCSERWAVDPAANTAADGVGYNFDGLSYQQKLRTLDEDAALQFEMRGRSYDAIMDAYRWDYSDTRFLNVRYEDVVVDFRTEFQRVFDWLQITDNRLLDIASRHDLNRMSAAAVGANAHVTDKDLRGASVSDLPASLEGEFRRLFPDDILHRLGYPAAPS